MGPIPPPYTQYSSRDDIDMIPTVIYRTNSSNLTRPDDDSQFMISVVLNLYRYGLPFLVGFGLTGNLVSVYTFLCPALRSAGSSACLVTLSIVDTLFLLTLVFVCMEFNTVDVYGIPGMCRVVVFVTYTCGFLSSWCIVVITAENYFVTVWKRHDNVILGGYRRAMVYIGMLTIVGVFLYSFALWTTDSRGTIDDSKDTTNARYWCVIYPDSKSLVQTMTYIDTAVTLVIPYTLLVFMLGSIMVNVARHSNLRYRLTRHHTPTHQGTSPRLPIHRGARTTSAVIRVTAMLTALSASYLILITPSHGYKLHKLISVLIHCENCASIAIAEAGTQQVFQFVYYLSFAYKFVVYFVFGKNFRRAVMDNFQVFFRTVCRVKVVTEL